MLCYAVVQLVLAGVAAALVALVALVVVVAVFRRSSGRGVRSWWP